jgi:hypothetical protein
MALKTKVIQQSSQRLLPKDCISLKKGTCESERSDLAFRHLLAIKGKLVICLRRATEAQLDRVRIRQCLGNRSRDNLIVEVDSGTQRSW